MTLRNRAYWEAHGEPYRLSRPAKALRDRLRGYGYTVYDYPDESHLAAIPPEDHDPFSATGYPVESAFGVGHAIDIMPPPAGSGLPSDREIGEQMYRDRMAELPEAMWVKYINHTDSAGACWHDKWQPDHARTSSSDKGHTHASAYSNLDDSPIGDTYDPVARWRAEKGQDMTPAQEYTQHVINYRVDALIHNRPTVSIPAFTASSGKVYPATTETNAMAAALAAPAPVVMDDAAVARIAAAVVAAAPAPATMDIEALKSAFADVIAGTTLVPNRQ